MQRRLHEHCSVVQRWPWYPPNSIIESSWRWPLNFTFSLLFCNPLTSLFQCVTSALSVDFYDRKTTLHKQCTLNSTFQKLVRRCVNQTSHLPLAASMSLAQPHTEKYELQRRRRQELWFRLRINYAAPWLTTDQEVESRCSKSGFTPWVPYLYSSALLDPKKMRFLLLDW